MTGALAFYSQDNWKVSRKLTLDIGIRYDLQNPPREDRIGSVRSPPRRRIRVRATCLGSVLYQGFGPNTCNCSNLLNLYKLGFAPRLGVAYQLSSKTVIRAGWGFFFGAPSTFLASAPQAPGAGTGYDTISFSSPRAGASALPNGLQGGLTVNTSLFAATLHLPGALPTTNPVTGLSNLNTPTFYDPALGRPPRISQYNIAVQRELIGGLTLEAAYVGNRGVLAAGQRVPIQFGHSGYSCRAQSQPFEFFEPNAVEFADRISDREDGRVLSAVCELSAEHHTYERPSPVSAVRKY